MSNCIEIDRPRPLRLKLQYVDVKGLADLVTRTKNLHDEPDYKVDPDGYLAWWFLSTNVEFYPDCVEIALGHGRSGHTNRDFRHTLALLAKFMLRPYVVHVTFRDEYDGFATQQRTSIELQNPAWVGYCI